MNQPKVIIQIAISEDNKVYLQAPVEDKKLCLNLLGDAIKIIANAEIQKKPLVDIYSVRKFRGETMSIVNLQRQEKKRIKRELHVSGKGLRRMQKKARRMMRGGK